jgi:hypothetical protein
VEGDRRLVGEVDERGGVGGDDVLDRAALLANPHAADPPREVIGRALLDDPLALDAVRIALQVQRTPRQMREHVFRDGLVVAGEVGLRDPVLREQRLVQPRHLDHPPPGPDRGAHVGFSRTTSRAGLSWRSPS